MPLYLAAHTAACLTEQALKPLMLTLLNENRVKVNRCLASQIGRRMLTEVEAPDQPPWRSSSGPTTLIASGLCAST